MTLYVWDNGEDYSDHEVTFWESDLPRVLVEAILVYLDEYRHTGFLVTIADQLPEFRIQTKRIEDEYKDDKVLQGMFATDFPKVAAKDLYEKALSRLVGKDGSIEVKRIAEIEAKLRLL